MPTVKVKAPDKALPRGAKVGEDIEIEERLIEELRARGAIDNVRRTLIAESGQLGASFVK